MTIPRVKDLLCDGHSLGTAIRIVGGHEEAAETDAERMSSAVQACEGRPLSHRYRGSTPLPEQQLRHGTGSRECADAQRKIAGEDAVRRQRWLDQQLNAEFGEGC